MCQISRIVLSVTPLQPADLANKHFVVMMRIAKGATDRHALSAATQVIPRIVTGIAKRRMLITV